MVGIEQADRGELIDQLRKGGMTQAEIATSTGLSRVQISHLRTIFLSNNSVGLYKWR